MDTLAKLRILGTMLFTLTLGACGSDTGFSLDGAQSVFTQSVSRTQVKVDILWVVDNSGSMFNSQQNVANNFNSFIQKFQQTNFDYQMAVTTSDAWRSNVVADPNEAYRLARFRDGVEDSDPNDGIDDSNHSGVTVIKPDTPDLENVFITNILQGINGSGDERSFESLQTALSLQDNLNEPFPRPDALLAVIVLTDEGDGSPIAIDPGNDPDWFQDKDYFDFLYNLSNSTEGNLNFVFNTIGILDEACKQQLVTEFLGRDIAHRNIAMSEKTGGYTGSLCDDFSDVLTGISDSIIEKSTSFKLDRQPAVSTIVVTVNGVEVPMDPVNGWSYNSDTMILSFHGTSVPDANALVAITFDPVGLL